MAKKALEAILVRDLHNQLRRHTAPNFIHLSALSPSSSAWRLVTSVRWKSEITNKQIVEPVQPPTSLNRSQFWTELKSKFCTGGKVTLAHLMWPVLLTIFQFYFDKESMSILHCSVSSITVQILLVNFKCFDPTGRLKWWPCSCDRLRGCVNPQARRFYVGASW